MITKRDYENILYTAEQRGLQAGLAQGRKEGREEGREEGVQLGAEKTNRDNARKMLALGASADFVRQVTGLSEEDVRSLMN